MKWKELKKRILKKITSDHRGILKCKCNERRSIVSNDGHKVVMKTGINTRASHSITYEMIYYAFEKLAKKEVFDSPYFRKRFEKEYKNAPCRYSMTGGILVEMGVANRHPTRKSCYYTLRYRSGAPCPDERTLPSGGSSEHLTPS
jgi:hypothetical protein